MALDLSRVRALCFDVDGTIADTDDHLVAKLAATLDAIPLMSGRRAERLARQIVMGAETPVSAAYSLLAPSACCAASAPRTSCCGPAPS